MNNSQTTQQQTWETYVSSWKAANSAEMQSIFTNCLAESCQYNDPLTQTNGHAELSGYITSLHQQIPGVHFVTSYFQAHNNRSIAKWEMRMGDGTPLTDGVSYGEYGEDGVLVSMSGFFELPQA